MSNWWLLLGMTAITYLNRYAFFARGLRYQPSEPIRQLLSYSSYAILTAIWAPIVFKLDTNTSLTHAGWDYLIGATLAGALTMLKVPSIVVVVLSISVFFGLRFVA